jgi:hypothetical protein
MTAVFSLCILPAVARWFVHALSGSNHSLTRARVELTHAHAHSSHPPLSHLTSSHSLALLPTTSQAHSLTSPRVTRSLCCQPPHRLRRFEKTNEKLDSFNEVAQARLAESQVTFARHTQLLLDAKKDLQSVFRRIRTLKARLSERYPEAFATVQAGKTVVRGAQVDADEDDEQ